MAAVEFTPNWFDSAEAGAPTLNNAAGSMINVLKAVCVSGFNLRAVTQIVVSSEVAVATAAGHGYTSTAGKLLLIAGVSEPLLNGRVQPTAVTTNTFTFAAPGVADGTYTGTITAKRAPLGWEVVHETVAGTTAIFRRLDVRASSVMLRVVDTAVSPVSTTYCHFSMVDSATDANTVTNEVPATNDARVIHKGANNATAKDWVIFGDELLAYVATINANPYPGHFVYAWGDQENLYPGDAGACILATHGTTTNTTAGGICSSIAGFNLPVSTNAGLIFYRKRDFTVYGRGFTVSGVHAWGNTNLPPASSVVPIVGDFYLTTPDEVRSRMLGLYAPQAQIPFAHKEVVASADRLFVALSVFRNLGDEGRALFSVGEPWRTA